MSVIGQEYKQPRVFAHDAWPVVIGAINYTWNLNTKFPSVLDWAGIRITNTGSGYAIGEQVQISGGVGTTRFYVTAVDAPALIVNANLTPSVFVQASDYVDGSYTGTVGVTAGYTTGGAGTGMILTLTVLGNVVTEINIDDIGTGWVVGDDIIVTGPGGVLGGATSNLRIQIGLGSISDFQFPNLDGVLTASELGSGFAVGDAETQLGTSGSGSGMTCTITNIDIPNTQEAGCCLYFSPAAAAAANLTVIMESGKYDNSAGDGYPPSAVKTFTLVQPGIFMPMLVKQITSTITAPNDILALY